MKQLCAQISCIKATYINILKYYELKNNISVSIGSSQINKLFVINGNNMYCIYNKFGYSDQQYVLYETKSATQQQYDY